MAQTRLTWWWRDNTGTDGELRDGVDYEARPYYATPAQEDRYRRFLALFEECEAEFGALNELDPERKSDQWNSVGDEHDQVRMFNGVFRGILGFRDHPDQEDRVLAGKPQDPEPRRGLHGIPGGRDGR